MAEPRAPQPESATLSERLARLKRFLPLLAALVAAAAVLLPRLEESRKSDPERIRDLIGDLVRHAEGRRVGRFLDRVSPTAYHDRFHADRDALARNLQRMAFRYRRVKVNLSELAITWSPEKPDRAEAAFRAEVLLGLDAQAEPTDPLVQRLRGTDRYRLRLRKEEGDWRVVESVPPGER